MLRFGTVSYNIYANFTNYGSALQTWALHQAINLIGKEKWQAVLVDYCPDVLKDKNPLMPFGNLWDKDEESRRMCELSLPAIQVNYKKFQEFYKTRFIRTERKYTAKNFNDIVANEAIDGFVCGSDTIFCIDEFGFDNGYYANYSCMKNGYAVAYAGSFGDSHFKENDYKILNQRIKNFKAVGLREQEMIPYVEEQTDVPVQRVLDPTLLLPTKTYNEKLTVPRIIKEKYILYYSRRYNPKMEKYVEKIAQEHHWEIVEISLRAVNAMKHKMFYEAGVEEFLSLIKYAEFVVTNSYHGMIFSIQYKRPFAIFSREQCDTKNRELLQILNLSDRLNAYNKDLAEVPVDYDNVYSIIETERENSLRFLKRELEGCTK